MNRWEIASLIDHAVLKPENTDNDVVSGCRLAARYGVAAVCVKPCHVRLAREVLGGSGVHTATVIGFPHGSTTTSVKVSEAVDAIGNGAEELDMVINVGKLLSGDVDYVTADIAGVVQAAHERDAIVKVIIETALLEEETIVIACKAAEKAGADFVKTSTGFNGAGATLRDIEIMKNSVSEKVKIKASGGIKNIEQAEAFAKAGCSRLGTSSTAEILGL